MCAFRRSGLETVVSNGASREREGTIPAARSDRNLGQISTRCSKRVASSKLPLIRRAWPQLASSGARNLLTRECEGIDQLYSQELDSFKKSSNDDAEVDVTALLDETMAKYPAGQTRHRNAGCNLMNCSALRSRKSLTAVASNSPISRHPHP